MNEEKTVTKRFSSILIAIILVILVLSLIAFSVGIQAYPKGGWELYLLIGFSGIALSAYMLLQTRRKTLKIVFKPYQIATTIMCQKCGFKNIREFERGDYIFKEVDECPKCKEKMMIASIYREAEEEAKD